MSDREPLIQALRVEWRGQDRPRLSTTAWITPQGQVTSGTAAMVQTVTVNQGRCATFKAAVLAVGELDIPRLVAPRWPPSVLIPSRKTLREVDLNRSPQLEAGADRLQAPARS